MKKNHAIEITPKDDAFHGSPKRFAAEWWYFDATLNDDLSVHVGFKTFTRKNKGFVFPLIEIYKNGKLEYISSNRSLFRRTTISKDFPSVQLNNKPIIHFDKQRYEKDGEWCYQVTLKIKELSVDLHFTGITKGWKIETPLESWTVALPKAKVTGTLTINDKIIPVEGTGYHDHNWNYSMLTALTYGKGWYWGKIMSETMTITWANIIKSSNKSEILSIVNQDGKQFFNINPSAISFTPKKKIKNHRKKTPTEFSFHINDYVDNTTIKAEVEMKTKELHFSRVLFAPYWRYHVYAKGYLTIGDKTEPVSNIQIMEYMQFDIF